MVSNTMKRMQLLALSLLLPGLLFVGIPTHSSTAGPGIYSPENPLLASHVSLMERLTGERLSGGNRVELLVNGPAAFRAMLDAVEKARDHINADFYIFKDDEMGQRFASIFLRKQAAGVQVNVMYDALGSKASSRAFFDRLKNGGVNIVPFNPPKRTRASENKDITHRDHRKLLIVDGMTAFTGGMNIGTDYAKSPSGQIGSSGNGKTEEIGWRDTQVQIEGPVVAQFQRLFFENWRSQNGPELKGKSYFPRLLPAGGDIVMAVGSAPRNKKFTAYAMYLSAFDAATRRIHLTNAYFVPDAAVVESLSRAATRGVDVRLVLPAKSDHFFVHKAGRSLYGKLLASGVRIYEFRGALLHAKTAVIDGVWSTVGSTNIDRWSLRSSDEINALVLGEDFGAEMERQFVADLKQSDEVTPEQLAGQSYWNRVVEDFTVLLFRWL